MRHDNVLVHVQKLEWSRRHRITRYITIKIQLVKLNAWSIIANWTFSITLHTKRTIRDGSVNLRYITTNLLYIHDTYSVQYDIWNWTYGTSSQIERSALWHLKCSVWPVNLNIWHVITNLIYITRHMQCTTQHLKLNIRTSLRI